MRRLRITRGKSVLLDDADYDRVAALPWQARPSFGTWYAQRSFKRDDGSRITINLARWLLGVTDPSVLVDHINGDGLDNRRSNLRCAEAHQNSCNKHRLRRKTGLSSKFKGVCWHVAARKWQARIGVRGKRYDLGRFDSEQEAHAAYVQASRKLHGEFGTVAYQ
jgi:hypothetical protein